MMWNNLIIALRTTFYLCHLKIMCKEWVWICRRLRFSHVLQDMKNPELLFGLTTLYCCHAENASEEHSKKIRKKTFYWQSLMTYVGYVNPFWPDENLSNFVKKTIKYFPYQFSIELMPFLFILRESLLYFIYKRVSIDFINMLFIEMVEKFKIVLYRKSIIVQQMMKVG